MSLCGVLTLGMGNWGDCEISAENRRGKCDLRKVLKKKGNYLRYKSGLHRVRTTISIGFPTFYCAL